MFHVATKAGRVKKSYKFQKVAQKQADKINAEYHAFFDGGYVVMSDEELSEAKKQTVTVINMMSKGEVVLPAWQVGDGAYDPSTEAYWSM